MIILLLFANLNDIEGFLQNHLSFYLLTKAVLHLKLENFTIYEKKIYYVELLHFVIISYFW